MIIDSAAATGADPSGASVEHWLASTVTPWAQTPNTSVLVLDHIPKRDKGTARSGLGGIGSVWKLGYVTGVSYLVPTTNCWTDNTAGYINLVVEKDKCSATGCRQNESFAVITGSWNNDGTFRHTIKALNPDAPRTADDADTAERIAKCDASVYHALGEAGPQGLNVTALRTAVRGFKATLVSSRAEWLVEEGAATKSYEGKSITYRLAEHTPTTPHQEPF